MYHGVMKRSFFSSKLSSFNVIFVGAVLVMAATAGFWIFSNTQTSSVAACVVTDKDRTTDHDGASSMRVYTENCGVLAVGDSLVSGIFNSADIYSAISVGGTYNFELRGVRVPILSSFPIITSYEEVSTR